MRRRSALLTIIAAVMFCSVFVFDVQTADAASGKSLYWLKVNRQANVVTAYKLENGKYVPYRAMVCSTGKAKSKTPHMTTSIKNRWRWGALFHNVWGQYCVQFKGNYLFHSVYYTKKKKKNRLSVSEYNKLGTARSMGCVRLSTMDAKWIYENCKNGTKVTVYSSKNPGPLGKPKALKASSRYRWDPTDPDKKNPDFRIKKPVITISASKQDTVSYGAAYKLKAGVKAKNVNAYQDLTSKLQVYAVQKYDSSRQKYVKASFSTESPGVYKVTYRVSDKYCGGASYKTFKVRVLEKEATE